MAEGLIGPDGKPVSLPSVESAEAEFHAAMAAPAADAPTHPAPPKRDAEAPFGRKADGTPRLRPAGPGRPKDSAPRVEKATPAQTKETSENASQRRAEDVAGLFQLAGAGLALAYNRTKNDAFLADAVAVQMHAAPMAHAVAEVAASDARFARVIDKLTATGPYAALIGAVVPLVAQLARNHGVVAAEAMGARKPADLLATLDQEQDEAA